MRPERKLKNETRVNCSSLNATRRPLLNVRPFRNSPSPATTQAHNAAARAVQHAGAASSRRSHGTAWGRNTHQRYLPDEKILREKPIEPKIPSDSKCIRQLSASGRKARQTAKLVRENSHQTEQSSDNSAQPSVKPAAAEHGPARLREAPGRATEPGNGCEHPTTERTGSPSNDQGRRQRINPASSNGPVPLKRRVLASARARSPRRPHSNNSA